MNPELATSNLNQRLKVSSGNTLVFLPPPPPPKKFKLSASVGKAMASFFFFFFFLHPEVVIKIDNLERWKTINGRYYVSEWRQLKEEIKSKCRGVQRVDMLLPQDNAPVQTAQVTEAETDNCDFELRLHPSYSPKLAPSDFLFPKLKSHFRGHYFGNKGGGQMYREGVFEGPGCHFLPGWNCNTSALLNQVHWSIGDLWWKIVKNALVSPNSSWWGLELFERYW